MPELSSHYMYVESLGRAAGAKTERWEIRSSSSDDLLGVVRWFGAWRQYIFAPEEATLFNTACLGQIADFLCDATAEQRAAR